MPPTVTAPVIRPFAITRLTVPSAPLAGLPSQMKSPESVCWYLVLAASTTTSGNRLRRTASALISTRLGWFPSPAAMRGRILVSR